MKNKLLIITPLIIIIILLGVIAFQLIQNNQANSLSNSGQPINGQEVLRPKVPPGAHMQETNLGNGKVMYRITK